MNPLKRLADFTIFVRGKTSGGWGQIRPETVRFLINTGRIDKKYAGYNRYKLAEEIKNNDGFNVMSVAAYLKFLVDEAEKIQKTGDRDELIKKVAAGYTADWHRMGEDLLKPPFDIKEYTEKTGIDSSRAQAALYAELVAALYKLIEKDDLTNSSSSPIKKTEEKIPAIERIYKVTDSTSKPKEAPASTLKAKVNHQPQSVEDEVTLSPEAIRLSKELSEKSSSPVYDANKLQASLEEHFDGLTYNKIYPTKIEFVRPVPVQDNGRVLTRIQAFCVNPMVNPTLNVQVGVINGRTTKVLVVDDSIKFSANGMVVNEIYTKWLKRNGLATFVIATLKEINDAYTAGRIKITHVVNLDTIMALQHLARNNGFVEYVADKYLAQILGNGVLELDVKSAKVRDGYIADLIRYLKVLQERGIALENDSEVMETPFFHILGKVGYENVKFDFTNSKINITGTSASSPIKLEVISEHGRAYNIWENNKVNGAILVHIDAHNDFAIPSAIYTSKDAEYAEGAFIYPAIYNGMFDEVYFVIPSHSIEVPGVKEIKINSKVVKLHTIYLSNLPDFKNEKRPVVVDIDADYFIEQGNRDSRLWNMYFRGNSIQVELENGIGNLLKSLFVDRHINTKLITLAKSPSWTPKDSAEFIASYFENALKQYNNLSSSPIEAAAKRIKNEIDRTIVNGRGNREYKLNTFDAKVGDGWALEVYVYAKEDISEERILGSVRLSILDIANIVFENAEIYNTSDRGQGIFAHILKAVFKAIPGDHRLVLNRIEELNTLVEVAKLVPVDHRIAFILEEVKAAGIKAAEGYNRILHNHLVQALLQKAKINLSDLESTP
ncbi:MAG: hypothetical protein PHY46_05790, partial [Candidatus Omnitrophica bacterium]|nr:hypothetical protein [Candidatus Omnitrophota bacterium]